MKEFYESRILSEPPIDLVWHPNSEKVAVIMDPRYDDLMAGVIRNFMRHLNPHGWNLVIITHEKHQIDIPGAMVVPISEKRIYYDEVGEPNITIDTYNGILMSREFWEFIPGEHILIFQKDCYMYKMFDESIYLNYAFCGANCVWLTEDNTKHGIAINGGCSLRKKSEMLDCLEKISWETIINMFSPKSRNEDIFFTFACYLLSKPIPEIDDRCTFAVEHEDTVSTCFYHGWNKGYQTEEEAKRLCGLTLSGFLS